MGIDLLANAFGDELRKEPVDLSGIDASRLREPPQVILRLARAKQCTEHAKAGVAATDRAK